MPVIIPKPQQEPQPAPAPPAAPALTRADVEAMLAAHDARWSKQLAITERALESVIAAMKPQPRGASKIVLTKDTYGNVTGATVTPQTTP